jgi:hypothetical protein
MGWRPWWRQITPPSQRVPLFSQHPPPEEPPPLEPESEADEPRTAGARRGPLAVPEDDASDTQSGQDDDDARNAAALAAALAADEEDDDEEEEVVGDDEEDAVMTDEEEEELAAAAAKPSAEEAREFKAREFKGWKAQTLRLKSNQPSSGRLVRTPTAERKVPRWVRTIPDPEFPELGIASVQQDDNDKSKQACTETLGSKNDDCSVHVQRNCEQKIVHKNKRAAPTAPTVLEKFQRDFNRIKNVPTLPLLWLCCYFFVNLWAASQPAMAAYFQSHAFVFRWTRVQVKARGI